MPLPPSAWLVLSMSMSLMACGNGPSVVDGGSTDATPDGEADGGTRVAAPDIPWLEDEVPEFMFTPCPDGWRAVVVDGVTECDPEPAGPLPTCDAGEARFPGES